MRISIHTPAKGVTRPDVCRDGMQEISIHTPAKGVTQGGQMNISTMFQNFMQNFVGDPTQILQQRINNGEISQQQYNQLRGIAENIVNTLPH